MKEKVGATKHRDEF